LYSAGISLAACLTPLTTGARLGFVLLLLLLPLLLLLLLMLLPLASLLQAQQSGEGNRLTPND